MMNDERVLFNSKISSHYLGTVEVQEEFTGEKDCLGFTSRHLGTLTTLISEIRVTLGCQILTIFKFPILVSVIAI